MPSEDVRFDGRAGEWFGIWIVNLLLSIVTIGIYSAWAKVRRNKYFYGNTSIGGRKFDYHATGMQILIGRLIVIGAFVVISILSAVVPLLIILVYIGLIFGVPYLIIRATKFQARNTSWSNVRFDFDGDYWDAFLTFVLIPIGVAFTLYLTTPFLSRRINRFLINGHKLGDKALTFAAPIGGFYMAFLLAVGWTVVTGLVIALLSAAPVMTMISEFDAASGPDGEAMMAGVIVTAVYGFLFIAILPATILYRSMVRNFVYAHTELEGGHRFTSTVSPWKMLWIAVSNAVVVICTLGLMLPWAQIRATKYLADQTTVRPNGSLDDFAGQVQSDSSAIGDAFGDIEGIDIGAVGL
jgi:uncharacterized membrane protein YjgN (DUF898 family)